MQTVQNHKQRNNRNIIKLQTFENLDLSVLILHWIFTRAGAQAISNINITSTDVFKLDGKINIIPLIKV
jgi:hypothetical protein